MATLSTLRDRIKSSLAIVGTTWDAQVDDAIRTALRQLRRRRYWFLLTSGTVTLSVDTNSVALPNDFGVLRQASYVSGGFRYSELNNFQGVTYQKLLDDYLNVNPIPYSQTPEAFAIFNTTLYLSHQVSSAFNVTLDYYRIDATLPTEDTDTSIWFDDGYDLVRSLALIIFKREDKGYSVAQADTELLEFYIKALDVQHESYITGGVN